MTEEITLPKVNRVCVECGSGKTAIDKRGNIAQWFKAERFGKNGYLCRRCYERFAREGRQQPFRSMNTKIKLMNILGQYACVFCGCQLFPCLQIEHKDGDGRKDRIRCGGSMSLKYYYINNPEEARRKLQIACANCNWLKRWKNSNEHGCEVLEGPG